MRGFAEEPSLRPPNLLHKAYLNKGIVQIWGCLSVYWCNLLVAKKVIISNGKTCTHKIIPHIKIDTNNSLMIRKYKEQESRFLSIARPMESHSFSGEQQYPSA